MNIAKFNTWTLIMFHILVRVIEFSVCRWLAVHRKSTDGCITDRLGKEREHTKTSNHTTCLGEHMSCMCMKQRECWCEEKRSEGCPCLLSVVIFCALVDQSGKLLFPLLMEVRSKSRSSHTGTEYDVLWSLVISLVVQDISVLVKQCSVRYVWNESYPKWLWVLTLQVFL